MHVAVGETYQRARDSAARPKDHIRICATGRRHCFELQFNLFLFRHFFEALNDFRVITTAPCDGRSLSNFDVAVLLLVYGWVIRSVGDINYKSAVRFEGVGY